MPAFDLAPVVLVLVAVLAWRGDRLSASILAVVAVALEAWRYLAAGLPWEAGWNAVTLAVALAGLIAANEHIQALLDRERALARTDMLSGLANRRTFLDHLDGELARQRRYHRPFTLLMLDVDDFKQVNDRLGHAAGDALVRAIGGTLLSAVRGADMVGRLGGDEFVVMLAETDEADATVVIDRLRDKLAVMPWSPGWPVSFSIGAVTCKQPGIGASALMAMADELMYDAKRGGKDDVRGVVLGETPAERRAWPVMAVAR